MAAAAPKTRDRILDAARRLFNDEGLPAVSTHRIAAEVGISPGNLHYHFRSKRVITGVLFRRFEDRLAPCLDAAASATALDDLWLSLHLTFEAINEYRFIVRDMEHLLNESPELEARAQQLTARQLLAAQQLCSGLAEAGVIDAGAEDIEMLALQIVFTTTCWYSFKRLMPGRKPAAYGDAALAAYYTLSLLAPFVVGESRDYLNFLRAKYLK
jgi:AcrR family transcriptional regulator